MSSLPPPPAQPPVGPPSVPPAPPRPPARPASTGPGAPRSHAGPVRWMIAAVAAVVIFAGGLGAAWLAFEGDDGDGAGEIVVPTTAAARPTTSPSSANVDPAVNEPSAADP